MNQDQENVSFEDLLKELDALVKRFEEGKMPLEEAISAYERGIQLQKLCEEKLQQAKGRIDVVTAACAASDQAPLPPASS